MRGGDCVIGGVYGKQTVEAVIYEGRTQQISGILRIVQRLVRLKIGGDSTQDVVIAAGLADARDARRIRHPVHGQSVVGISATLPALRQTSVVLLRR